MKYLVTGAAGFIGNAVSIELLKESHQVVGIDNINDYYDVNLKKARIKRINNKHFQFFEIDISNKKDLENIFLKGKFDYVIHLAAQAGVRFSLENPDAYVESNIKGFTNILECCRHYETKHLVYASSSSVYGLNKSTPYKVEDSVDHPISLYAATKKSNELFAHTYSHLFNLPTTGLRYFTVYGPWGRPDMAPFIFTEALFKDKKIKVFNNGEMWRDFTYIDDVVDATILASKNIPTKDSSWNIEEGKKNHSSAPYRIYNLGRGNSVNLLNFIECLEEVSGKKVKKEFIGMQPGDVKNTHAESEELFKAIKFSPRTNVIDGVQNFVSWYKNFYKIK